MTPGDKGPYQQVFHSAEAAILAVSAEPAQWSKALSAVEQEQRRIAQFGVRPEELTREIDEFRVNLQSAVAGQATRRTPRIAAEIVQTLDQADVYTAPEWANSVALDGSYIYLATDPPYEGDPDGGQIIRVHR